MDRIINVKVGGNYLSKDNKAAGVRGEGNVTKLRITFDAGWDGFAKTVTFFDALGKNPVKRTLTADITENLAEDARIYLVPIPAEPMAETGELTFIIDGYIDGKRQRSIADKLVVKDAPNTDTASEPVDPTPSQAEQLQKQYDGIMGYIQSAAIARNQAEQYKNEAKGYAQQTSEDAEEAKANAETSLLAKNEAEQSAAKAENAVGKTNYIGENGNWYTFNPETQTFTDSGVDARGYIPKKGTDYYTPEEKQELIDEMADTYATQQDLSDTRQQLVDGDIEVGFAKTAGTSDVAVMDEKGNHIDEHYASNDRVDTVESIAKGANQAVPFANYRTMINALNAVQDPDKYNIGQNIYIRTVNVPDLWISGVTTVIPDDAHIYTTDENFVNELNEKGYVWLDMFQLSQLETQKANLTNCATKEELRNVDNKVGEIISGATLVHTAQNADRALFDWNGNDIHLHYATKTEVGEIETALDEIITLQEALILPDAEEVEF